MHFVRAVFLGGSCLKRGPQLDNYVGHQSLGKSVHSHPLGIYFNHNNTCGAAAISLDIKIQVQSLVMNTICTIEATNIDFKMLQY